MSVDADQRFFAGRFVAGALAGFRLVAAGFLGVALAFGVGLAIVFVGFALVDLAGAWLAVLAGGLGFACPGSLSTGEGAAGVAWTSGGRPVVPRR